jgi:hypothetical protein
MNVDIQLNNKQQQYELTFNIDDISSSKDKTDICTIVACFAYDFELDPELEIDDIDEIINRALQEEKSKFTFEISEDNGIEVSFP